MGPVRELVRLARKNGSLRTAGGPDMKHDVRGLRTEDFFGRARAAREMESVDDERTPIREFGTGSPTVDMEEEESVSGDADDGFRDADEEVRR